MQNLEIEIRQQVEVLGRTIGNNMEKLEKIVAEAKNRRLSSVYFVARGTSDHACIYAQYLFGILCGIPCALGTPSVFTKYGSSVSLKNMLVIGVSQSGKAEDCLAVLESARREGALTVSVTNDPSSPMAQSSKYSLFCDAGEEKSIAATKTLTSEMALLGALCGIWSSNSSFLSRLSRLSGLAETFLRETEPEITKLAGELKDIRSAVVLGRGISYPIALEGALKLLETNKIPIKGYAASDFYHGPVAQIAPGDTVFLLAPSGACFDDAREMAEKLENVKADLIIVTDPSADPFPYGRTVVLPDTGSELTAPFMQAMFFQLLACRLSEVRGVDPEDDSVIRKVTITR
ncbi:MAG: SIS domain-containing protein [Clostridia bacterium]|nr:SIS domain-containing protein [Clostridia bacterium]